MFSELLSKLFKGETIVCDEFEMYFCQVSVGNNYQEIWLTMSVFVR